MEEQKIIRLNYSVHLDGKDELVSIKGEPQDPKLNDLDKVLLKKKPSNVKLSIGTFRLESDFAEVIHDRELGGYYIMYRRVGSIYEKGLKEQLNL